MSAEFPEKAAPGPSVASLPVDLYPASHAPDARYSTAPREAQAWQFSVDQAAEVIDACQAATDAHTQDMGPLDGPLTVATVQPGLPLYGYGRPGVTPASGEGHGGGTSPA